MNRGTQTASLILVLASVALTGWRHAVAQEHRFTQFNVQDGLVQSQAVAIFQDSRGFLWIGTKGGVSRFDGHSFQNFTEGGGRSLGRVVAFAEAENGDIWMGSESRGAFRYDGTTFTSLGRSDGLISESVSAVARDTQNRIWFGTTSGASCYQGGAVKNYGMAAGLHNDTVNAIVEGIDGLLWFGTARGVFQFDDRRFVPLSLDSTLSASSIHAMDLADGGTVWFATSSGIASCDSSGLNWFTPESGAPTERVNAISHDQTGNIWLATAERIVRFDGQQFSTFQAGEGLATPRFWAVHADAQDNIWVGSDGDGLIQFHEDAWLHFNERTGLANQLVMSFAEDSSANMWFGTAGGGAYRFDGQTLVNYSSAEGIAFDEVYSIAVDKTERVWLGTEAGLSIYDGREFAPPADGNAPSGPILDILILPDSTVWVATLTHGLFRHKKGKWSQFTAMDGIGSNRINAILEDRNHQLWLATPAGLTVYDGTAFKMIPPADSVDLRFALSLALDNDGNIWVGTLGNGLARYTPAAAGSEARVRSVSTVDGLVNNEIVFLVFDAAQNLWAGTDHGIDRLDVRRFNLTGELNLTHFGRDEGFVGVECNQNAGYLDRKGQLWFGSLAGASMFSPEKEARTPRPIPTYITGVNVFADDIGSAEQFESSASDSHLQVKPRLAYAQNHLTFNFIGADLSTPMKVRYRYKLDGLDQNWSPATSERCVTYPNLPAGDYEFKVMATNQADSWPAEAAVFVFEIAPPFWQTWWFRLLVVVLFGLAIYGLVRYRTRALQEQRRQLAKIVEKRTAELRAEKHKVEQTAAEMKKLSLVASETENAVVIANATGEIEWVNSGFTRLSGFSLEEIKALKGATIVELSTKPNILEMVDDCVTNRKSAVYEAANITKDGQQYWVSTTMTPTFDALGNLKNWIVVDTDVTHIKRTEQALVESQTRLELMNSIAAGIRTGMSATEIIEEALNLTHCYFPDYQPAYSTIDKEGYLSALHTTGPAAIPSQAEVSVHLKGAPQYLESLRKARPMVVRNVMNDDCERDFIRELCGADTQAVLGVPVFHDDELIGVVSFNSSTPHSWSDHEITTLKEIADHLRILFNDAFAQQQRARAERQVRIQKAYFEQLFENSPEGVVLLDTEGRVLQANSEFTKLFGFSFDELMGQPIDDLIRPGGLDEPESDCQQLDPESHLNIETVRRRKDGELVHVSLMSAPIQFDGGFVAVYGIYRDITERKQAEAALRESETRLRILVENAPEALIVLDPESGYIVEVNENAVKLFGHTPEEFKKLSPIEFSPPTQPDGSSSAERAQHYISLAVRGDTPVFDWVHCHANGDEIPCEIRLVRLPAAGKNLVRGSITDITERKQAEENLKALNLQLLENDKQLNAANSQLKKSLKQIKTNEAILKESENKYRTLFNYIADPIMIFDKESKRFLDCNEATVRVYGYSRDEFTGMTPLDLHPSDDREYAKRNLDTRSVDTPSSYSHVTKTGRRFSVDILTEEIEYQGRQAWISIVRDVTERQKNELELSSAKDAAESANSQLRKTNSDLQKAIALAKEMALRAEAASVAKSDFLANMSHEIRTPLNAIIGMTELVLETGLNSEQSGYLSVVQSASEGLLSLINDILDFSKIEAGQMEIESVEFKLHAIVEGVAEIFGSRAENKGLDLLCFVDPCLPLTVVGDPTRLRQILVNLVGNAIKFTESGEVSLAVELAENTQSVDAPESIDLLFKVSDTGTGISSENIQKIFEKFSQEDTSTTRKFGGTGLGLNISKSLVNMMGGKLWVESTEGEGSTFMFSLNLPAVHQADADLAEIAYLCDRAVLVVDGNKTSREYLRRTLEAFSCQVMLAGDGPNALTLLDETEEDVCVAIIDKDLPGMSGADLARKLADSPKFDRIRIVMMTRLRHLNARLKADLGFAELIPKPVKQSQLKRTLLRSLQLTDDTPERVRVVDSRDLGLSGAGQHILLVEDNADNQVLALRILEKAGFKVEVAGNGVEATEAARRHCYDLVLMDIYMPVMDGFEATRNIRIWQREQNLERIPIIALTAHAIQGYREKCLQNDMDDYITKPVKKIPLLEMIDRHIDSRPALLIVDDSADNRNLLLNQLRRHGDFRLVTAQNGQEAVDLLRERSFALVLMDMEMPVMDGYTAASALRKQGLTVPIVALTAHRGPEQIKKCLQAGCSDYLAKPVRKQQLCKMVAKQLAEGALSVECGV